MAIETPAEYGGAESSFTSAIIAIEELAKVDPSVSVLCDVHNTLVNTIFRTHGTKEQKERFLPMLSENKVHTPILPGFEGCSSPSSSAGGIVLFVRAGVRVGCVRTSNACKAGRGRLDHQRI